MPDVLCVGLEGVVVDEEVRVRDFVVELVIDGVRLGVRESGGVRVGEVDGVTASFVWEDVRLREIVVVAVIDAVGVRLGTRVRVAVGVTVGVLVGEVEGVTGEFPYTAMRTGRLCTFEFATGYKFRGFARTSDVVAHAVVAALP